MRLLTVIRMNSLVILFEPTNRSRTVNASQLLKLR